jgi:hypothetical protein
VDDDGGDELGVGDRLRLLGGAERRPNRGQRAGRSPQRNRVHSGHGKRGAWKMRNKRGLT